MFVGLLAYLIRRLQSVMNAHITDALVNLHWLRIPECIQFKVAVLVYKVLHGLASQYLGPLSRVFSLPGRRALRSASTNQLDIRFVRLLAVEHSTLLAHKVGTVCQLM